MDLAREVDRWPVPAAPRGHLEFFVERLVRRRGVACAARHATPATNEARKDA